MEAVAAQVLAAMVGAWCSHGKVSGVPDAYAEYLSAGDAAHAAVEFAVELVYAVQMLDEQADDLAREARERRP